MADLNSPVSLDTVGQMKVIDLRQELDKRGLEKSGLKADLVKRLEKSLLEESMEAEQDSEKNKEAENNNSHNSDVKEGVTDGIAEGDHETFNGTSNQKQDAGSDSENEQKEASSSSITESKEEVAYASILPGTEQGEEELEEMNVTEDANEIQDGDKEGLSEVIVLDDDSEEESEKGNEVGDINELPEEYDIGSKSQSEDVKREGKNQEKNDKDNLINVGKGFDKLETCESKQEVMDFDSTDKTESEELNVKAETKEIIDLNLSKEKNTLEASIVKGSNNDTQVQMTPLGKESVESKDIKKFTSPNLDSKTKQENEKSKLALPFSSPKESGGRISSSKSNTPIKGTKLNDTSRNLNRCLWISGLSSITKAADLKELCVQHGKVVGAKVVTSAKTPGSQCFGFVTMATVEEAKLCIEKLHKSMLHEKTIQVEKAKTDPTPSKKPVVKKEDRSSKRSSSKSKSVSSRSRRDDRTNRHNREDRKRSHTSSSRDRSRHGSKSGSVKSDKDAKSEKTQRKHDEKEICKKTPSRLDNIKKEEQKEMKKDDKREAKIEEKRDTIIEEKKEVIKIEKKEDKKIEKKEEKKDDDKKNEQKSESKDDKKDIHKDDNKITKKGVNTENKKEEKTGDQKENKDDKKDDKKEKKDVKSLEQIRKERADRVEKEHHLREERKKKERERERKLREERRLEQERREKERRERARKEAERVRKEREKQRELEKAREREREKERERFIKERKEREEKERKEREREREQLERERLERERLERERKERERIERERQDRERQERERLERERLAREERELRIERERQRLEQERLDRERQDRERQERERQDKERQDRERQERERRVIDRGIDRGLGENLLKRPAQEERGFYKDAKRSALGQGGERKDFFSSRHDRGPDEYIKDDVYDMAYQRRTDNNRSEVRNESTRTDFRRDSKSNNSVHPSDIRRVIHRDEFENRPYRDRSPTRTSEHSGRYPNEKDQRSFSVRDRNAERIDRPNVLEPPNASAPKTLSDVLGRAGLSGILGSQSEPRREALNDRKFDKRPYGRLEYDDRNEQHIRHDTKARDSVLYNSETRGEDMRGRPNNTSDYQDERGVFDSRRESLEQVQNQVLRENRLGRINTERRDYSDVRGNRRELDDRRGLPDGREIDGRNLDIPRNVSERRDVLEQRGLGRLSEVRDYAGRTDARYESNAPSNRERNNHHNDIGRVNKRDNEISRSIQNDKALRDFDNKQALDRKGRQRANKNAPSITDRRGLHPVAAEFVQRPLSTVSAPRIVPFSDILVRPLQPVAATSQAAQALQAGYAAAAHGLALQQATQSNIHPISRNGRIEYARLTQPTIIQQLPPRF